MSRWSRSPAVLMTAYLAIFLYAGPWARTGGAPHRNIVQVLVAVALAVSASRGSRAARALMIAYSAAGLYMTFSGSTSWWSLEPSATRFDLFACYLAQICLLISTPMFQRTRPGWSPGESAASRFLPAPRLWMVMASMVAGLVITLLPFANLRPVACPPGHVAASSGHCLAHGTGYPISYRSDGGVIQIHATGVHWLFVQAHRGTQTPAFAADWGIWSLAVLLPLYLAWLNKQRDNSAHARWQAMPPGEPANP